MLSFRFLIKLILYLKKDKLIKIVALLLLILLSSCSQNNVGCDGDECNVFPDRDVTCDYEGFEIIDFKPNVLGTPLSSIRKMIP